MSRGEHPSGFPQREERFVKLPIERLPRTEPLTPRLRHPWPQDAIGFHHIEQEDIFDD